MRAKIVVAAWLLLLSLASAEAGDIRFSWVDHSVAPTKATLFRIWELTPTGLALPNSPGLWTEVDNTPAKADIDPTTPAIEQETTVVGVANGVHTYVVTSWNGVIVGGVQHSTPSNRAVVTVVDMPVPPSGLPQAPSGFGGKQIR